jgi:dTDP-4-amino-4,6-dideoxygalactose transaminase
MVTHSTALRDALSILDRSGAGLLLLVDGQGRFERTISDGDLRRLLLRGVQLGDSLDTLPTISSVVAREGLSRRDALALMNRHAINHLPALDGDGRVTAVLERRELDQQILLSTPHMGDAEREFIEEAFRTNWIAPLGPNVDSFERELAESVGVRHAAAVSSGTAAIHLALVLLGIGRGDRVFCSTLTFAASAFPILYQGAEPVFIDSERASWNMSPRALERALEESRREDKLPKAIVVVNLYGQNADMDPILALCERYGVPVVEDAAESLGAQYKGKPSGTFGRLGIYSFNGNKIITTSGGGMLVSDESELIERARALSTQARDPAPHYQHSVIGYNYRMSNILAGVGRGQLRVLDQRVQARRAVFERYRNTLADIDAIEWMPEPSWSFSTHWLTACTVQCERSGTNSAALIRRLAEEMIEARPVWKPLHLQPVFAGCRYFADGDESVSERLFRDGLCLPSGSNMSEAQLERTIACIRSVWK